MVAAEARPIWQFALGYASVKAPWCTTAVGRHRLMPTRAGGGRRQLHAFLPAAANDGASWLILWCRSAPFARHVIRHHEATAASIKWVPDSGCCAASPPRSSRSRWPIARIRWTSLGGAGGPAQRLATGTYVDIGPTTRGGPGCSSIGDLRGHPGAGRWLAIVGDQVRRRGVAGCDHVTAGCCTIGELN